MPLVSSFTSATTSTWSAATAGCAVTLTRGWPLKSEK
jgi:hypothetical protein